jgi:hypothetical protein
MYGRSVGGLAVGSGALAVTGFGIAFYVLLATILMLTGSLLVRFGRRRAARS